MKVKTDELTGAALDWAVCHAEGTQPGRYTQYSTDWRAGGPIIERECIELVTVGHDWRAMINTEDGWLRYYGPTPLIAAMRCYVASQLGDEVDVPEELMAV